MVAFPLLLIPFAIVNIILLMMPSLSLTATVASLALKSDAIWSITVGDILLALAALLLMFELVKAARPGAKTITEMLLAILLCGGAIAEFVLLPPFATSIFFLLIVMSVVDVIGSLAIARHSRKRVTRTVVATPAPSPIVEPATRIEPTIEPASPVDVRPEPVVPEELRTAPHATDAPANDTAPRKSPYTPDGVPTP